MPVDFYRHLKLLDGFVHRHPEDSDSISQRQAIANELEELGRAARRLAADLRAHPPPPPGILYDGHEGEWEEMAYVPVAIAATPKAAIRAIPEQTVNWAVSDPGMRLHCDSGYRCHLAPTEFRAGDEDWYWTPCPADAEGAVEFWRVEITEPIRPVRDAIRRFKFRRALRRLR